MNGPTLWGEIGYGGMYGLGARYMIPVGPSLLKNQSVRDQLAVEFGLDFFHQSYSWLGSNNYSWSEVLPVVGALWSFWFNPKIAVYPKIDFGYAIGWLSGFDFCNGIANCSNPTYGGFFWNLSAGALYNLGAISARLEIGNELVKAGAQYVF